MAITIKNWSTNVVNIGNNEFKFNTGIGCNGFTIYYSWNKGIEDKVKFQYAGVPKQDTVYYYGNEGDYIISYKTRLFSETGNNKAAFSNQVNEKEIVVRIVFVDVSENEIVGSGTFEFGIALNGAGD